jgi:hypothetical protein
MPIILGGHHEINIAAEAAIGQTHIKIVVMDPFRTAARDMRRIKLGMSVVAGVIHT